jgi:neurotransmitter:Na+ symporter, NSS family
LGNVWRFPTVVAENGGGTFVLVYLVVVFLVGIPMMIVELTMGRAGKRNVIGLFRRLAPRSGWWLAGLFPVAASFIVLSFYSVVAGWVLLYIFSSLAGFTAGLDAAGLEGLFAAISGNSAYPLIGQALFLFVTAAIVVVGIKKGIERWGKVLMPGIFFLLLVFFIRTMFFEGVWEGIVWFLQPDLGALTFGTALEAVGQVFFSFSLGMGAIITYGSYLPRDSNIPHNSLLISMADVGVALLTGLIVIPSLFVFGLSPETGPGLIFITLPSIFNTLPFGILWSSTFFLLLAFAALTSAISLLEVLVAYLVEEMRWSRFTSALTASLGIFALSIPAALSQGVLAGISVGGLDIFEFLDFTTSNVLLPLGGLLAVLFTAWIWGAKKAVREIEAAGNAFKLQGAWSLLVRFVVPLAIAYILFSGLR